MFSMDTIIIVLLYCMLENQVFAEYNVRGDLRNVRSELEKVHGELEKVRGELEKLKDESGLDEYDLEYDLEEL